MNCDQSAGVSLPRSRRPHRRGRSSSSGRNAAIGAVEEIGGVESRVPVHRRSLLAKPPRSATHRSISVITPSGTSLSEGRVARTVMPLALARATDSRQTVVFPMPGSPSRRREPGPRSSDARNAVTSSSSEARPTTSPCTGELWHRPGAR